MTLAFGRQESHPMVDALLRTRIPRAAELNRAVDERDDMLDFAIKLFDHDRDRAITNYFQNGLDQYALLRHVAAWRSARPARMLDFASGYGRMTRFLVHDRFADEITVSDILEGGMAFQAGQFGVRTILSKTIPEEFEAPGQYDLIFVASLFTHLPPVTFTRWLKRLSQLLSPDGLLVFSVHDQSIAPVAVDDISFESRSESRVLDVEEYGSTWVTESFVRTQVSAIGEGYACVRLPRALAEWQDVYVISPAPIEHPLPRRLPKGFVDHTEVVPEGLLLRGWASLVTESPSRVELRLDDDVIASTSEFGSRPDVAAWLGVQSADAGWELLVPHASIRSFRYQVATLSAFSREGEEKIVFLGTLDSLRGSVAEAKVKDLEQRLGVEAVRYAEVSERLAASEHHRWELEQQIAAMRQSRFWKARERWFAIKRAAGLTDET